jgi:hypothetical protein
VTTAQCSCDTTILYLNMLSHKDQLFKCVWSICTKTHVTCTQFFTQFTCMLSSNAAICPLSSLCGLLAKPRTISIGIPGMPRPANIANRNHPINDINAIRYSPNVMFSLTDCTVLMMSLDRLLVAFGSRPSGCEEPN